MNEKLRYSGDIVILKRLVSNLNINLDVSMQWNKGFPISPADIYLAQKTEVGVEATPFGHMNQKENIEEKSNDYHIRRILYFMNNPEEIRGIELDNECYGSYISTSVVLIDGWHRLFAAILLSLEYLHVNYGGRTDILKYLTGESDIEPFE